MRFEALDGTKLLVLMIAGAAFAGIGLYLLVRQRPAGSAKIELFGLKFESSSAGLLVFLIGAAFMAIPLFAPEREVASSPNSEAAEGVESVGSDILPNAPETTGSQIMESEPNDRIDQASKLLPGQILSGDVRPDDGDWIRISQPKGADPEVTVRVRNQGGGSLWSTTYSASEERLGARHSMSGASNHKIDTAGAGFAYVYVSTGGGTRVKYQVLIAQ